MINNFDYDFYASVVPLLAINGGFILGYIIYLLSGCNKKANQAKKTSDSGIIIGSLQNYWFAITNPFVDLLIKLKITPNFITVFGVFISIFAGLFFGMGLWGLAGWTMIAGGVFDLFDGRVARATNRVTKNGAFLDSVMDRYSDGAILTGLAWYFKDSWLLFFVLLCFVGFYTVSYAKARSEASGVKCDVGTFQRPERIFMLGLSSIFTPILSYYSDIETPLLIYSVIIILGVGTVITSIYRTNYSFRRI